MTLAPLLRCLALASALLLLQAPAARGNASPEELAAPPAAEVESDLRKAVRSRFSRERSRAREPWEKAALARDLIQVRAGESLTSDERYAWTMEILALAEDALDPRLAFRVLDDLGDTHDFRLEARKAQFLASAAKVRSSDPELRRILVGAGLGLARASLAVGEPDAALAALDAVRRPLGRMDSPLHEHALQRIEARTEGLEALEAALLRLEEAPEDSAAHDLVGRTLCFELDGTQLGLEHLARGSDETLAEVARLDLDAPTKPEERMALAVLWEQLDPASLGESGRRFAGLRAARWLRLAAADRSPGTRLKQDQREQALARAAGHEREFDPPRVPVPNEPRKWSHPASGGARWLIAHQAADGSWPVLGFTTLDQEPESCSCAGRPESAEGRTIGLTALALLALIEARDPAAWDAMQRAAAFLERQQIDTGQIGEKLRDDTYAHAIATYALCRMSGAGFRPGLRPVCERAVDFALTARNPYSGWRYAVPPDGESDPSITGWMISALAAARDAGIEVPDDAFLGGQQILDELTDAGTGRVGYVSVGGLTGRHAESVSTFPSTQSEAMTASGLNTRALIQRSLRLGPLEDVPVLDRSLHLLDECRPEDVSTDYYYWYFGARAMNAFETKQQESWRRGLRTALDRLQVVDEDAGCALGSWSPDCAWGPAGGRVYSTAMGTLCAALAQR